MKKIYKSFLQAFIITTLIHSIAIIILLVINTFNYNLLLEIISLTIPILFTPCFLSFYFYDVNQKFTKLLLKVFLYNFVIIFFFTYCFFKFIIIRESHSVLSYENFTSAFISSLICMFFAFFHKIKETKTEFLSREVKFSYLQLFLISFSGVLLYILIIAFEKFSFSESVQIIYNFLPVGFIFSLINIHFFNYVYQQFHFSKRKVYVAIYYMVSISILVFWIIISVNNFRIVKSGFNITFDGVFLISSILLYAPFFIYVLIVTHLYFIQLLNKQEKTFLTQQSLESQLNYQQLKNQISPHFLFNNINVLTSLIEENPKKAVLFSENLSHIYRYFLEQEKQDVVLVKNEIEFAKSYLELLKDRFESGLNFIISVDEKSKEKYIVSTILQQVLENVVKHNEISSNTIVSVKISSEENYLVIKNNKNLKQNTTSESKKGIENIKQRIAFFTDKKVIIEDTATHYIIKLPTLETV